MTRIVRNFFIKLHNKWVLYKIKKQGDFNY